MTIGNDAYQRVIQRIDELRQDLPHLAADVEGILSDEEALVIQPEEIEIERSRSGVDTLRLSGRWVHSRFAPLREAEKRIATLFASDAASSYDGHVVLGLGLGYHIEALRRFDTVDRTVVAVVYLKESLVALLERRDAAWWLAFGPHRVVPAWLPGVIPVVLRDVHVFTPSIVPLDSVSARWPDQTERVVTTVAVAKERNEVNRNTLRRFGKLWVRNAIRNLAKHGTLPGIDDLAGIASGVPALVIGAGPTLDEIEDVFPALARRHVVIAVDTALPVLARWGVSPHFAIVSDPQYWNTRHLDRVHADTAILIIEPATHPRTLRLWNGPVRVSASLFPIGAFFDTRLQRHQKLGAGGSVATSAWDLARLLGSADIALAGIDLGFPHSLTHCKDSFFENLLMRRATRIQPGEHGMSRYLHDADSRLVPTVGGEEVVSDRRMEVYRSWFSEQTYRYPDVRTVLLSPLSSKIGSIDLETAETRIQRLPVIDDRLRELRVRITRSDRNDENGTQDRNTPPSARQVLDELDEEIAAVCTVAERGISLCDRLERSERIDLTLLDAVDNEIGTLSSRELVGFLATDAIEAEVRRTIASPRDAVEQSKTIYRAIWDSGTYHRELIRRHLS